MDTNVCVDAHILNLITLRQCGLRLKYITCQSQIIRCNNTDTVYRIYKADSSAQSCIVASCTVTEIVSDMKVAGENSLIQAVVLDILP